MISSHLACEIIQDESVVRRVSWDSRRYFIDTNLFLNARILHRIPRKIWNRIHRWCKRTSVKCSTHRDFVSGLGKWRTGIKHAINMACSLGTFSNLNKAVRRLPCIVVTLILTVGSIDNLSFEKPVGADILHGGGNLFEIRPWPKSTG